MAKGEQTRGKIVERAFALSREVGLEGLTLAVLAADTDMSKSGLFAHFKSKEALQMEVLQHAIDRFVDDVVRPILPKPRGEPRIRALFDNFVRWVRENNGSCFFIALSQEYDDRPGPVHNLLTQSQHDWRGTLARAAGIAVDEGHFRADLDLAQFAHEFVGIDMSFQQAHKLLKEPKAENMARTAFEALLERSRAMTKR